MSNVKVNGNTYNGVTRIKLMKADDSGYATYTEGEVSGGDYLESLMDASGASFPGYENAELTGRVSLGWLTGVNNPNAEIYLPNVTKVEGGIAGATLKSLRLPKAADLSGGNVALWFQCIGLNAELVDFSGVSSGSFNQAFQKVNIGTLKLGAMPPHNLPFGNATITNLIWNNPNVEVGTPGAYGGMCGTSGLTSGGAKFTNVYVPDSMYDSIKAFVDDGTLTTVTNLYKISEWSDG